MKNSFSKLTLMAASVVVFASCSKNYNPPGDGYHPNPDPQPQIKKTVVTAYGDSAGIVDKLIEFRALAGNTLNSTPGVTGGRREVNWDGVPVNFTNNNNFPFDFFGGSDPALANGRKRGLLYNSSAVLRVDSTDFSEIDRSYADQFEAFSRKRLFSFIDNNVSEINFKVPGTTTDASISAFGVIFSDVDNASSTYVEYFNGDKSLGSFRAIPSPQGFSFVGVSFTDEKVTRVKITSGNGILGAGVKDITDGGGKDLVVMDDFIYSEPVPL